MINGRYLSAVIFLFIILFSNTFGQQQKPDEQLAMAVFSNDLQTVREAIRKGADVNAKNDAGETIIFTALITSFFQLDKFSPDMIRLLVDNGADVNARNREGQTPLFIVCSQGLIPEDKRAELAAFLLSRGAVTGIKAYMPMYPDGTPLLYAAMNGYVKTVETLIKMGADPLVKDDYGNNALYWSVKGDAATVSVSDKIEIIKLLLKNGADPHNKNENEETALSLAKEAGSKLLEDALNGKSIHVKPGTKAVVTRSALDNASSYLTASGKLTAAIRTGDLDAVKQALESGAEITLRDENGNTPLLLASDFSFDILSEKTILVDKTNIYRTRLRIIKYLLGKGAEINEVNHLAENALAVAVKTMVISGKKNITADLLEVISYLVKNGSEVDIDATTTPLMDACEAASPELVSLLLPNVKNINKKSNTLTKMTALAYAIGSEALMLAESKAYTDWLKSSGASDSKQTEFPNEHKISSDAGRLQIVKSLIEKGADVNLASGGIKPLRQARIAGFNDIAGLLRKAGAKE